MTNVAERDYKIGDSFYVSFIDGSPPNTIVKYVIKDIKQKNATIIYITDVYTFNSYREGAEFERWWFDTKDVYYTFSEAKTEIQRNLTLWAETNTRALQEEINSRFNILETVKEF